MILILTLEGWVGGGGRGVAFEGGGGGGGGRGVEGLEEGGLPRGEARGEVPILP